MPDIGTTASFLPMPVGTLVRLPVPLRGTSIAPTLLCSVVSSPLPSLLTVSVPLCSAILLATVMLPWMGTLATMSMIEAITVRFVDGLLPGAVFLGMRMRTLCPENRGGLTFSLGVIECIKSVVVLTDLPTMLFSPFAAPTMFPFGSPSVLTRNRLLFARA